MHEALNKAGCCFIKVPDWGDLEVKNVNVYKNKKGWIFVVDRSRVIAGFFMI